MPDLPSYFFALNKHLLPWKRWILGVFIVSFGVSLLNSLILTGAGILTSFVKTLSLLVWIQAFFLWVFIRIYTEKRSQRAVGDEQFFYWVVEWGGGVVCLAVVLILLLTQVLFAIRWLFG